jgi:flagellar biosynthesis/type III secretory pathway protein FliH
MAMGDVADEVECVEERAVAYAAEIDSFRKAIKSLQTQLAEVLAERDQLQEQLEASKAAFEDLQRQIDSKNGERFEQGVKAGKAYAFGRVQRFLGPFAGADPEEGAVLLDLLPGLIRRMTQREGVDLNLFC